ncbi:alpha/beta hydrolase [Photorhabdus stackebrandtii]|uniref:Alpha/beta hydrolase n=1 Tax=Photorhabdus stackebrandtii TaxID=1123042 RepID=A0A7X5QKJ2_9GAMM|nr:alpha/beta fold hydrolase [Photorhabdus stackebrandtii]NHB96012.1 alpha/beta hydrolase [Photorhabdus stackebrandtii]
MLVKNLIASLDGEIQVLIATLLDEQWERARELMSEPLRMTADDLTLTALVDSLCHSDIDIISRQEDACHLRLNTLNGKFNLYIGLKDQLISSLMLALCPLPDVHEKSGIFTEKTLRAFNFENVPDGLVCLPSSRNTTALVLLVAGSGPHSMDYDIGPNPLFRMLAHELSQHGIASVRFDKRYYRACQGNTDSEAIDLNTEVIDDACNILAGLMEHAEFYNVPVFLVGHSFGGYVSPLIAKNLRQRSGRNIMGIAMLATPFRSLFQVILSQLQDANLSPECTTSPDTSGKNTTSLADFLAVPDSYLKQLKDYHAFTCLTRLPAMPLFFAQGDQDFQVPHDIDFTMWKTALKSNKQVEFKLYTGLNHILLPMTGCAGGEDYLQPGQIPAQVIADLAAWISHHSS